MSESGPSPKSPQLLLFDHPQLCRRKTGAIEGRYAIFAVLLRELFCQSRSVEKLTVGQGTSGLNEAEANRYGCCPFYPCVL